jgi:insertion element IS1 protein InsB
VARQGHFEGRRGSWWRFCQLRTKYQPYRSPSGEPHSHCGSSDGRAENRLINHLFTMASSRQLTTLFSHPYECLQHNQKLWICKALDQDTGELLDWECGCRGKVTLKKMVARLTSWDEKGYCTDPWDPPASVIPQGKLGQSKTSTRDIERNHGCSRHWFGRFKRKSSIVSKSKEMENLP